MFLCLDLVLVIRNPFGSKVKRAKFYYLISYSISAIMALLFGLTDSVASYIQLILMFTYLFIAISSILYCVRRLSSTGLSDEIKALIYRRHIYWIVSFIVANTYLIFLNLVVVLVSANRTFHINLIDDNRALKFFAFFTNGQGFFIVFHVLVEP